jgi:hypothetical protein
MNLERLGQKPCFVLIVHLDLYRSTFFDLRLSAFLGVEVVLTLRPCEDLAILRHLEAL